MSPEQLKQLFELVVFPVLLALSGYAVSLIHLKSKEIKERIENDKMKKYIDLLDNTICSCVIATNQTYTEELKKAGRFDKEAQQEAFRRTYENVLTILTAEAREYLAAIYGDLDAYLKEKIESEVLLNK